MRSFVGQLDWITVTRPAMTARRNRIRRVQPRGAEASRRLKAGTSLVLLVAAIWLAGGSLVIGFGEPAMARFDGEPVNDSWLLLKVLAALVFAVALLIASVIVWRSREGTIGTSAGTYLVIVGLVCVVIAGFALVAALTSTVADDVAFYSVVSLGMTACGVGCLATMLTRGGSTPRNSNGGAGSSA